MSSVADHKREPLHHSGRQAATTAQQPSFARLVESAVVVSWVALFSGDKSGIVHVDCRFGDQNEVEHLTIWVATERGEWRHAGEYSVSRSKRSLPGMSFKNGYRAEKLSSTLNTILAHQHSFVPLPNPGRDGLIEIGEPTPSQRRMAESTIASMLQSL
jgi:hypothetical protein